MNEDSKKALLEKYTEKLSLPEINCKFCGNILTELVRKDLPLSKIISFLSCKHCTSSIPHRWHTGCESKHEVTYYLHDNSIHKETLILDGFHIETRPFRNTTTVSECRHGGPLEFELFPLVVIPATKIDPTDPNFKQKLKIWLTFS